MVAGTSDEGYIGCCAALAVWDHRDRLPAITAPTLVVAGADDAATPVDPHARTLAAGIPGRPAGDRPRRAPGDDRVGRRGEPALAGRTLPVVSSRQVGGDRRLHGLPCRLRAR